MMEQDGETLPRHHVQSEAHNTKDLGPNRASAPGQGQWSQREKRKMEIALKDKELERDQDGRVIWTKKAKRKNPMESSLALILEALEGTYINIDLKNGSIVSGTINSVDPKMNVVLVDATMTTPGSHGSQTSLEQMELKGQSIYFIHLPAGVNISAQVEKHKKNREDMRKKHELKKGLTAQK